MNPIAAIEARQKRVDQMNGEFEIGSNANSLEFLQACYRSPQLPLSTRIRCAVAALQFEHPRLGVTAIANMSEDFAARLERAIMRSTTKVIEHEPNGSKLIEPKKVDVAKKPVAKTPVVEVKPPLPTVTDRRFRRI